MAAPRKDGACPLFIAAQSGYAECARLLLEAGAEVDQARLVRICFNCSIQLQLKSSVR